MYTLAALLSKLWPVCVLWLLSPSVIPISRMIWATAWTTEYIFFWRWNRVSVSAHSAGAYTATLLVMVNVKRGGGRAPRTLTSQGQFYPHHWKYARKQQLQLCVLCGLNDVRISASICTPSNARYGTVKYYFILFLGLFRHFLGSNHL